MQNKSTSSEQQLSPKSCLVPDNLYRFISYIFLLFTDWICVFLCVCACGFSCVSLMTAAQREGNTLHLVTFAGANAVAMAARLDAFWQVWFALDRNMAAGPRISPTPPTHTHIVLVSYTIYTVSYSRAHTHTHTHTHTCTHPYAHTLAPHAAKLHFNWRSFPGWEAPCWSDTARD